MSRKQKLGAAFAALVILTFALICVPWSREPSYADKPLSFWCDHLPFTDQLQAPIGNGFVRMYRSSTNQAEKKRFREMEQQALTAIDTLGTNCLPALLSRLQKKRSPFQFESRKLAAKLGFIKKTEVGIWHMRRMEALTGIVELGERARVSSPELVALKSDPDPWLSAAAAYALQQIAPQEIKLFPNEGSIGK